MGTVHTLSPTFLQPTETVLRNENVAAAKRQAIRKRVMHFMRTYVAFKHGSNSGRVLRGVFETLNRESGSRVHGYAAFELSACGLTTTIDHNSDGTILKESCTSLCDEVRSCLRHAVLLYYLVLVTHNAGRMVWPKPPPEGECGDTFTVDTISVHLCYAGTVKRFNAEDVYNCLAVLSRMSDAELLVTVDGAHANCQLPFFREYIASSHPWKNDPDVYSRMMPLITALYTIESGLDRPVPNEQRFHALANVLWLSSAKSMARQMLARSAVHSLIVA
jgi:hypothetical protein